MTLALPDQTPHDETAEQAVIGAMLKSTEAIDVAMATLSVEDFHKPQLREVFTSIQELWSTNVPIDLVSVSTSLANRKAIDKVGGYDKLAEFLTNAPLGTVDHLVKTVKVKSQARAIIAACYETLKDARDGSIDSATLLDRAEQRIFDVSTNGKTSKTSTISQAIDAVFRRIDAGTSIGKPTGFADLDKLITGFRPGQLVILAARPSVGKTAFALNLARNFAERGQVYFASLEQGSEELGERMLCAESEIDSYRLNRNHLNESEKDSLTQAAVPLGRCQLIIDESGYQTINHIASGARRAKRRGGLEIVIIDYLQLIVSEKADKHQNRENEVSTISRRLKALAKELQVPVLCLAQLNRQVEQRSDPRPRLADLRESGAIEQDADVVLLLWRIASQNEVPNCVEIGAEVAKHRNGPTGAFNLILRSHWQRFENHGGEAP